MKNKLLIAIVLFVFCFTSVLCFGADVNTSVDSETSTLTVSGKIEGYEGKQIAVQVLNPGKQEDDVYNASAENFFEVFASVGETTANENGTFIYSFELGDKSGFYSVRIRPLGGEIIYLEKCVKYITPNFENDFLTGFSNADPDDKIEILNTNAEITGINIEDFSKLEETNENNEKLKIINLMGESFQSLDDFVESFELSMLTYKLNKSDKKSVDENVFNNYTEPLKKACQVMSLYDEYIDDESKTKIAASLAGNGYIATSDMINDLGDKIVLESVAGLKNSSRLETVLKNSSQWLDADFSTYFALGDKSSVNSLVAGKTFETVTDLCQAITKAMMTGGNNNGQSSSNQGSSPISGGGNGSSVSLPAVQPIAPPSNNSITNPASFNDLSEALWAKEAVEILYSKGIINGSGDGKFEPSRNITRAEFTKILVEAFFDADMNATESFDDVTDADWYKPYVATALKLGIANGTSQTTFAPNQHITRQDMAVMVANTAKAASIDLSNEMYVVFNDSDSIAVYAKSAVEMLCSNSVISGFPDGSFVPNGNATRAQCANLVYKLMLKNGGMQ